MVTALLTVPRPRKVAPEATVTPEPPMEPLTASVPALTEVEPP